jgi:hypothetical protein
MLKSTPHATATAVPAGMLPPTLVNLVRGFSVGLPAEHCPCLLSPAAKRAPSRVMTMVCPRPTAPVRMGGRLGTLVGT